MARTIEQIERHPEARKKRRHTRIFVALSWIGGVAGIYLTLMLSVAQA